MTDHVGMGRAHRWDGWPGWALPKAWQKSLKELKTLSKCASHLSAVRKPAEKKSKRSVHLNSGCSNAGSPAAEMEGNGEPSQPVLVPYPSRATGEVQGAEPKGRRPLEPLHGSGGGREQADLCAALSN